MNTTISVVARATDTATVDTTVAEVLQAIRVGSDRVMPILEAYRQHQDPERKRELPAAMFSGRFARRRQDALLEHSGLLCLDFDDLPNPEDTKRQLRHDEHVYCAFISPGLAGLKVLVRIPPPADKEGHGRAYLAAERYFALVHDLEADPSGKDVTRLCFLSYDPELFLHEEAQPLPVEALLRETPPPAEGAPPAPERGSAPGRNGDAGEERPGDRYNADPEAAAKTLQILLAAGWQIARQTQDRTYLTRPGKERGISATLWSNGTFHPFTSSTEWTAGEAVSPFAVYAHYEHQDDFHAAAKTLGGFHGLGLSPEGAAYYGKGAPPQGTGVATGERDKESGEVEGSAASESAPEWPPLLRADELVTADVEKRIAMRYPQVVHGLIHQGTKAIISSASKAGKTWLGLHLALSVASGSEWLGHGTTPSPVLYTNYEIPELFLAKRIADISSAMGMPVPANLIAWNLRGVTGSLDAMTARLREQAPTGLRLIVIDPIYKMLMGRDENSAGDMQTAMAEIDRLIEATGAAVLFVHHFSKGNKSDTDALDRASGSGVFARDPDSILSLTTHEEEEHFTVECALRNLPPVPPFVIQRDYPLFRRVNGMDPAALRRPGQKICPGTVRKLIDAAGSEGKRKDELLEQLREEYEVGKTQAYTMIRRLLDSGRVHEVRRTLFTVGDQECI